MGNASSGRAIGTLWRAIRTLVCHKDTVMCHKDTVVCRKDTVVRRKETIACHQGTGERLVWWLTEGHAGQALITGKGRAKSEGATGTRRKWCAMRTLGVP